MYVHARAHARVSWLDIDERPCGTGKYQSLSRITRRRTRRRTIWPMIIPVAVG